MFRLYVTEWAPNGTSDLLVADHDNQVIASFERAVFGLRVSGEPDASIDCDGNVMSYVPEFGPENSLWQVTSATVVRHVAASPVNDGSAMLREISKLMRGAK